MDRFPGTPPEVGNLRTFFGLHFFLSRVPTFPLPLSFCVPKSPPRWGRWVVGVDRIPSPLPQPQRPQSLIPPKRVRVGGPCFEGWWVEKTPQFRLILPLGTSLATAIYCLTPPFSQPMIHSSPFFRSQARIVFFWEPQNLPHLTHDGGLGPTGSVRRGIGGLHPRLVLQLRHSPTWGAFPPFFKKMRLIKQNSFEPSLPKSPQSIPAAQRIHDT